MSKTKQRTVTITAKWYVRGKNVWYLNAKAMCLGAVSINKIKTFWATSEDARSKLFSNKEDAFLWVESKLGAQVKE